jgi:hypothetical protein
MEGKTERKKSAQPEGIESDECPVSVVHRNPEMQQLVQILDQSCAARMRPVTVFGPVARWDAKTLDLMAMYHQQRSIEKSTYMQAVRSPY